MESERLDYWTTCYNKRLKMILHIQREVEMREIAANTYQMTMVVYMVKPMNFASLKFSGTFRVLTA